MQFHGKRKIPLNILIEIYILLLNIISFLVHLSRTILYGNDWSSKTNPISVFDITNKKTLWIAYPIN